MALIDKGAWMNMVTLAFVKKRGLAVGLIKDLNKHKGHIPVSVSGVYYTEPLGYVMVQVQIPGIPSHDEYQVALVIRDQRECGQRVPEEWQQGKLAHKGGQLLLYLGYESNGAHAYW